MGIETAGSWEFAELVARFPLRPLEDDHSYRSAIAVLDRLFALDSRQTPVEIAYFRALARIARDYEIAPLAHHAPGRTHRTLSAIGQPRHD